MLEVLAEAGHWSIEFFWLPMLIWTVVALPTTLLFLSSGRGPAQVRYGTAAALIAALPIGMIAAALFFGSTEIAPSLGIITLPAIAATDGPEAANGLTSWAAVHTAGLFFVLAVAAAAWRIARLFSAAFYLRALRKSIGPSTTPELQSEIEAVKKRLRVSAPITAAVSPLAVAPITFGWMHPIVLVPEELLQRPDDLRLALLHELTHVRRRDYAVQWIEQLIGALFIIHPLVAILRHQTTFLREAACDAEVVRNTGRRAVYARLLYSFSATSRDLRQLAVGIFLQERHLTKRIIAMNNLADATRLTHMNRLGLMVTVLVFGLSASLVACTEQFVETDVAASEIDASMKSVDSDALAEVDQLPKMKGGLAAVQANLVYPELARKAGVEGRVVVSFVVDENGHVRDAEVVNGLGSGLDEAARRAVELATFEPGLHEGKAVKVKMALPISFKLGAEMRKTD